MSTEVPEVPDAPKAASPGPARKSLLSWPVAAAAAIIVAATLTVGAVNHVKEVAAAHSDTMRNGTQAGGTSINPTYEKILNQPGVQAFHDDPVFKVADWAAYSALSTSDATGTASLRKGVANLDYVSGKVATVFIDAYDEGAKFGAVDPAPLSVDFLNALNYTRAACKAPDSGSTPVKYIAGWTVDTAFPRPVIPSEVGTSYAAAKSSAQKAYVAAMAAGIRHLCPQPPHKERTP